jgi:hypothetical protein
MQRGLDQVTAATVIMRLHASSGTPALIFLLRIVGGPLAHFVRCCF